MNAGFRNVAVSVGLAVILVAAAAYFIKLRETVPDSHAVVLSEVAFFLSRFWIDDSWCDIYDRTSEHEGVNRRD